MNVSPLEINVAIEHFPLKQAFKISRGSKTQADVIVVTLSQNGITGWAEAVPYARYGESIEACYQQILAIQAAQPNAGKLKQLIDALEPSSAKNVLDCAWLDFTAKQQQKSVSELLHLTPAIPCITAQTISVDTPEVMAQSVRELHCPPLIKIKLDNEQIVEKVAAIHTAAPQSDIIVDANESWSIDELKAVAPQLAKLNVALIEQPLAAGQDDALINYTSPVPLCADESCHTSKDLAYLAGRYQAVNIKLDKTGGLTGAVQLAEQAQVMGFDIMLGCMVGSSLAMAPISLLSAYAKFVDLDGPLLVAADRKHGFAIEQGNMPLLNPALWGGAV